MCVIIVIELVIYIKKSFICYRKYFENNSSKIIKSPRHIFSMHVEHVY